MRRTGRWRWKGEGGQGLVEFALILPVLLLLILGIMEFGLLFYNQQVITNASREGARYGIVSRVTRRDPVDIEAVVNAYCVDHLVTFGPGSPITTVEPSSTSTATALFGDDLRVAVSFRYDFLVLPNFVGDMVGALDLQAETTMKYE